MARFIKNPGSGRGGQNRLRPYEALYRLLVRVATAKGRKVMSYTEFLSFTKIKNCFYCGDAVEWRMYRPHGAAYNLDRWNSCLGYSRKNSVVCCGICNTMKNDLTPAEFFERIGRILHRRKHGG